MFFWIVLLLFVAINAIVWAVNPDLAVAMKINLSAAQAERNMFPKCNATAYRANFMFYCVEQNLHCALAKAFFQHTPFCMGEVLMWF